MLTPQEVSTHVFSKARMGGYNMAMVDEFLDTLTEDYTTLYKENAALKAKLKVQRPYTVWCNPRSKCRGTHPPWPYCSHHGVGKYSG